MSEQADRDELAIELHRDCPFDNEHIARLVNYETGRKIATCPECFDSAGIVNGTEWLAQRDRRVAAEALREAAEELPARTEGTDRSGTATWRPHDRDVYSLAIEEAQSALRERADRIEAGDV